MEKFTGLVTALALACAPVFAQTAPGAVNIQNWQGMLVDAACAASQNTKADQAKSDQGTTVDSGRPEKAHSKAGSESTECAVSNSTSAFALKTTSGQVLQFDSVGNMRAAEALKNKANWTKDLSAGKPVHAKVSGTLSGETITVASLH